MLKRSEWYIDISVYPGTSDDRFPRSYWYKATVVSAKNLLSMKYPYVGAKVPWFSANIISMGYPVAAVSTPCAFP